MRALRLLGQAIDVFFLFVLVCAATGFFVRDRVVSLAPLTYLPVPLLTGGVLLYDASLRSGRMLRPRGAGLALAGLLLGLSVVEMSGQQTTVPPGTGRRVVQSNVWWGGGRARSRAVWARMQSDLLAQRPEILILSEAPERAWLEELAPRFEAATGRRWWMSTIEARPRDRYWFRLVVLTPFPHRSALQVKLHQGVILQVVAEAPEGPLRIWAVDGVSSVRRDRRRMLNDLTRHVNAAFRDGRPPDILAGDFNAPAKSVGFDRLRRSFWLASEQGQGWRATWPSWAPLVDVDHIWVRRHVWTPKSGGQLHLPGSDHRAVWADVMPAPLIRTSEVSRRRPSSAPTPTWRPSPPGLTTSSAVEGASDDTLRPRGYRDLVSHLDHSGLRASASVADSARMEGVRRSGDVAQASDLLAPTSLSPMSATRKLHSCGKSLRFSKVAVRLRRLEPEWTRSGAITLIVGSPSPSSARDAGPPGQRVRA